jgi:hypothetical protein
VNQPQAASNPVLIVMAKAPRPEQVKTRLCPPLQPAEAASLAAAFLQDIVTREAAGGRSVLIAHAPADGRAEMEALLFPGLLWTPQRGADLGARMLAAMLAASRQAFSPLVMIGTDSPTLPRDRVPMAFELLASDRADVVLGPTEDGGYYLVGVQTPVPALFDAVAWSTERALADTLRNATACSLRVAQLPAWYDIDTPDDLRRLRAELHSSRTARKLAPGTCQWFSSHETVDNRTYAK